MLLKNLEMLCYPVGAIWLLLVAGACAFLWKRKLGPAVYMLAVALLMTLVGSTSLAPTALATLERPFLNQQRFEDLSTADAVVMLGGGSWPSRYDRFSVELAPASDRWLAAIELMRLQKAPTLVIGGGSTGLPADLPQTEGQALEKLIRAWNLPAKSIVALPASRNTRDEALAVQRLVGEKKWQRVYLVTSASHMARAAATFRKAGINVTPVACDFSGTSHQEFRKFTIVPDVEGFMALKLFLHEKVGWQVYGARGWL